MVRTRLFEDTSAKGWYSLRIEVIKLISGNLKNLEFPRRDYPPGMYEVFNSLQQMGEFLLGESPHDREAIREVVAGMMIFGKRAALLVEDGNYAILQTVIDFLRTLIADKPQSSNLSLGSLVYPKQIEDIFINLAKTSPWETDTYDFNRNYGLYPMALELVKGNDVRESMPPGRSGGERFRLLDALERVGIACIKAENWLALELVLEIIVDITVSAENIPRRAAFCMSNIGKVISKREKAGGVIPWQEQCDAYIRRCHEFACKGCFDRLLEASMDIRDTLSTDLPADVVEKLDRTIEKLDELDRKNRGVAVDGTVTPGPAEETVT